MGRPRKYFTEEERKAAERESKRRWRANNAEKVNEANRRWKANNKEKIADKSAEYYQKNKEKIAKRHAEYYQSNKEKITEMVAEYYQSNKEKITERVAEYRSTPFGRAMSLLNGYRRADKKHSRGECTLTPDWIMENIFSQPCHYCGKTDWHELGCDRIDNSLPHTPDNVVPCCWECNIKKQKTPYDEFMKLIGKIA